MNLLFIAGISFSLTTVSMRAGELDGWGNLNQVTRDRVYSVIFRDGHCATGSIVSASKQTVLFAVDAGKDLIIKRTSVLRLSDALSAPAHDAIFSGRSSWFDVKESAPRAPEYLHIVTKRSEEWKWSQPLISDASVAFENVTVAKADIRYVSYVRFKPLTRREEYVHHENVDLLAPRLWFNYLMLGRIGVLLYNSELAEDNSPVGCH